MFLCFSQVDLLNGPYGFGSLIRMKEANPQEILKAVALIENISLVSRKKELASCLEGRIDMKGIASILIGEHLDMYIE